MPAAFSSVDEFLAAQTPERRADVEAFRKLVREAEPGVAELVKWNSPSYTLHGIDRLTINAAGRGPVRLVLHHGPGRAENRANAPSFGGDPDGLLTWHSDIRATLTLPTVREAGAEWAAVVAVVRAWLAETAQ